MSSTIKSNGLFEIESFSENVQQMSELGVNLELKQYDIIIKNSIVNFTRTVVTNDSKLWILLYRNTNLTTYSVTIKMSFLQNGVPFDYTLPPQDFAIQKSPSDQVDDFNIKQQDLTQLYPTITSFDFYNSSAINFNNNNPITSTNSDRYGPIPDGWVSRWMGDSNPRIIWGSNGE